MSATLLLDRRRGGPRALRAALSLAVLLLAVLPLGACVGPDLDREVVWPTPARGMVVSEHPLATEVGLAILDRGGNAADAAVATALALAVVYPQAGNLGGGGFALWVPHQGPARALDFRETAPAAVDADTYLDDAGAPIPGLTLDGALAAGVPGTPEGLWRLHSWAGALSFREVVAPAVALAAGGFEVEPWLARDLRREKERARLEASPGSRALFYPEGEPLEVGDRLVQPELAATLERYAREGPAGFYRGPVAARIVEEMVAGGGAITAADLAGYASVEREPLVTWFRGLEIVTMPPPSSGGIVLSQVLRVLDGFPLDVERDRALARAARDGVVGPEAGISERALHWWIEAMRVAFADRAEHLGDPDHADVPTEALLSQTWINARRMGIGERASPGARPWVVAPPEAGGETTHLCVLDEDGNAVSLTTTLNTTFGSGLMVRGAGFLLNNEMDDFALRPGVPNEYGLLGSAANAVAPGKRPLSSLTPTVIRGQGGIVRMVIGSPGGPRIITAIIQVILRVLVYGQELEAAIRAPRLHQQWKIGGGGVPERTRFEQGWAPELLESLRLRGHAIEVSDQLQGSVQAILVELGGEPEGFSDARRGGVAGAQGGAVDEPARPPEP